MLKRCEDTNLCLNWEKSHFMVKEGNKISKTLKTNLCEVPILIAPNWDMPFELMCDASDFAIRATILLGRPEDIYAAVDSCETAQEIWLRVQQMMKGSDIGIQEKKAKLFNEWERFTSNDGESIESHYHHFLKLMNDLKRNKHFPKKIALPHQDQRSFNQNYMQQPMPNPEDITYLTTAMNMALALMVKAFKLKYSTPTNNNQRISSNLRNRQIAQPGMNMGQDRQMQMIGGNANHNPNGNGNLVAVCTEGNATGYNENQIRCYNCKGVGHFARNCTVRPRRRDAAYLQTQLLIAQKEEAGIQLQDKEFDLMAAVTVLDEIKEVNVNCILMANLQQASTSGTQTDKAPIYDSDGSAEVHDYENCYDNEIFNMFTQEEQYIELLEPIPESHQVPQNDNYVISEVTSVEQSGGTVEQHPTNVEKTCVLYDSLYHNLAIEVEKVNTVNRKLKETNAKLTTELARFKNQEKCFEIKKKKLKSDFKIREDELLDKQIQLEKRIKELDSILVKTGQSIQTIHMLSPKPDSFYHTKEKMDLGDPNPFYLKQAQKKQHSLYDGKVLLEKHDPLVVYDSEETLQLAQESQKMKQLNKEIKPANYTKINHLSGVFVSQTAKSREELYFSNTSKTANVSKPISIPNEEFSDDTTPSVARKFLNEVKSTIVTLQQAAKFVGDFKSLAKEADESLAKHKALELEIKRLLRAVVSQDIMYKKCEECKFDKISYDKAYNDMQQMIEWLQAQLGDLKGKSKDTSCVSDTLNPLSQKCENKNVELEFQVRAQLFNKVSDQKDNTRGTSANTKFAKQSIMGILPKVGETHALSKSVTSNTISTPQESKVVKNDKVIAPGMFRINPFKTSREDKHVPNNVRASARTTPITVSQPTVFTKKDVNSDSNGLSSTE
uniref:DNA-directed DNA polymerase n=1 Tax=Tanacetum cinerariifolium TaxID=118510 RepID=A0A699IW79_TANCI|nr:DNA-directed DNA polymerase [Tanacetum cinerariifolium]